MSDRERLTARQAVGLFVGGVLCLLAAGVFGWIAWELLRTPVCTGCGVLGVGAAFVASCATLLGAVFVLLSLTEGRP